MHFWNRWRRKRSWWRIAIFLIKSMKRWRNRNIRWRMWIGRCGGIRLPIVLLLLLILWKLLVVRNKLFDTNNFIVEIIFCIISLGDVSLDSPDCCWAFFVYLEFSSVIVAVVFYSEGLTMSVAWVDSPKIRSARNWSPLLVWTSSSVPLNDFCVRICALSCDINTVTSQDTDK